MIVPSVARRRFRAPWFSTLVRRRIRTPGVPNGRSAGGIERGVLQCQRPRSGGPRVRRPSLLGVTIDDIDHAAALVDLVVKAGSERAAARIYNVNLHALNLAYQCPQFRSSLASADLTFSDGVGVSVAAAITGQGALSRHTPPDWLDDLAQHAAANGVSIYLLGDEPGVAAAAAARMSRRHPTLHVAGTHHGFFAPGSAECRLVIETINAVTPGLLLVGMGMPRQEFWIDAHRGSVAAGAFVPVGAAFRWYAGIERRGPRWVTDNGGEWLWRLAQHPVRLFSR